ncbi:alpha/beta hydrolase [Paenibacillus barcinonensis]|uniref:Alpha/beta hydrolase n=1 Tax=Paenibacillus barcinonensis TaxID=198119 RepID=A0A2V4VBJ4_PAEBA|nr:alpha/beta hydrolase [Paenibacillus barcinonensis]PYE49757.1 pimeloyl-ACP methyl ester carboxylesterase [Paenibacillus barcinonensis]QKS56552.1 alpha/beta hydrolase [Paenibacillus barcinonensis]
MKRYFSLLLSFCLVFLSVAPFVEAKPTQAGSSGLYEVSTGVSLYAKIQGVKTSLPTVVFIGGYGDASSVWNDMQSEISKTTLTVSYDRAGLGLSDDTTKDKTTKQQVKELHKLLRKANIPGPYVLVGHSLGGLNVRAFADRYADEVAGAVLIDASHEKQEEAILATLPPELKEMYLSQFTVEGNYTEVTKSFKYVERLRAKDALRNLPLTVISATEHGMGPEMELKWADMQLDLASLSNYSTHVIAQGSGHYVYIDQPELVKQQIITMLDQ